MKTRSKADNTLCQAMLDGGLVVYHTATFDEQCAHLTRQLREKAVLQDELLAVTREDSNAET